MPTRWADNDSYGHINNVVYYAYFDTVVNTWLMEQGALQSLEAGAETIGLVVETQCRYFASAQFPDVLEIGLRLAHVGTSSVRYELAVFRDDHDFAVAQGHFVHVYVHSTNRRPVKVLPGALRTALAMLESMPMGFKALVEPDGLSVPG
ncbi:acyl-CoA thioesterase [Pseudomonas gingeri]|uniref:Acyl-CoA thioesterase n=1 Tax=Pseudomonas gingeri TaxID=117681 RepID=A0A7Y8CME2_9PSED|nr:thioesterase family protein [Pseudomonas gingeri]NWA04661.1 acyl-CoA thioesterase [Pseudomonas gingeri]NWA13997.1 acyl-CoA thioesterase [Pseudomonas gingeri]NWA59147.1 acyl-CoA thioesterase [Pseudomonas gingeri]NWA99456.1 acyl-CoA thioesterase [Pseudomonas gingeri]NWB05830.1 acyl-CoA thioesterase [Pseudomonas gingeri]